MSTPCNGCKALVIQTADDYDVYSLQRAIYPVDPLMILPQPNQWVSLDCATGQQVSGAEAIDVPVGPNTLVPGGNYEHFIVRKLFTQGDDWTTFWQQMLAECANHTVPEDPVVLTDPNLNIITDYVPPPVVPPPPDPDPDKVPGPDTKIQPPPVAPPPAEPTPVPNSGGSGNFVWPPNTPPPFPHSPPSAPVYDPPLPPNNPGKQWAIVTEQSYAAVFCTWEQVLDNDSLFIEPSTTNFAFAMVEAAMRAAYQACTEPKYFFYWMLPTWEPVPQTESGWQNSIVGDQGAFEANGSPWTDILAYAQDHNVVGGSYFLAHIQFKFIWEVDI